MISKACLMRMTQEELRIEIFINSILYNGQSIEIVDNWQNRAEKWSYPGSFIFVFSFKAENSRKHMHMVKEIELKGMENRQLY